MGFDFNADDIFEMAEQIERNGAKFYRTAAEKVADSSAKELLLWLAGMEDEHEKTFALLRADLSKKEKAATVFDPEGESALYLRALADIEVFLRKILMFHRWKKFSRLPSWPRKTQSSFIWA